jgi:aldose 1-epimerase
MVTTTTFRIHTLQLGALRLEVNPLLGGSVHGLWHNGQAILRPTPPAATHAGQTAAFPLIPYSNRIGYKAFVWQDTHYTVLNDFDDGEHGLHGIGFMTGWQVVAHTPSSLSMRLEHPGDAHWPFAFVAEQHLTLHDHGMRVRLSLLNTDARTQPAGLGWHPYFVRRASAELEGNGVHTQWLCGSDMLPTEPLPRAGLNGPVAGQRLDHCFEGGSLLGFSDEVLSVELQASSSYWVVFTPADSDFFCIEPVTHLNNAVHMVDPITHGTVALKNGQSMTQEIDLRVSLH